MARTAALIMILAVTGAFRSAPADAGGDDVSTEKVREAAEALVARRFSSQAEKLEVRVVRIGGSATGEAPLEVLLPHADRLPRGHAQVRLFENGTEVGWALLFVAHYDSVAVIRTDARAGEAVGADDVRFAWIEVTSFHGDPLTASAYRERAAAGLRTARRLRAGDALRIDDLRAPYAADTGENVAVVYRRGPVLLRVTCQAREPGSIGEVIRVYCSDTRTTYKAKLTAPGKAEWAATL